MGKFLQQALDFLHGLRPSQKPVIGRGGAAVFAGVLLFSTVLGKQDYKTLYSGLAAEEAQSVARHLAEKGISYEVSTDGTSLRVAPDQIDKARLDLAAQGLPRSGRLGFEIFDKPNWAGSDFAEKVNYQRALEGELERTIQTIQVVEAVRVHLVMPRESLFIDREREAKAAVVLKLRSARIEEDSVRAIGYLVASSVDTLKPENVTVVGADGRPLSPGSGHNLSPNQSQFEAALLKKLVATLVPVIGEDRLRATVNVDFDTSQTESTQESYDPQKSAILISHTSEDRQGGGTASGGVPGTASNVPQASPPGAIALTKTTEAKAEDGQFQKTSSETYAVSKMVRHNLQPAGMIKRVAVGILVDDAPGGQKRMPEELKQLEDLAKAAVGFDGTRGDTLSLRNISFQVTPAVPLKAPDFKDKVTNFTTTWQTPLRSFGVSIAFLMVYLLIVKPLLRPAGATLAASAVQATPPIAEPAVALAGGPAESAPAVAGPTEISDDHSFIESELQKELNATSSDVKRAVILKRHLVEKVKTDPAVAGRLIQNWLRAKGDRRS